MNNRSSTHQTSDRVLFYGAVKVRIESPYFLRRRIAVVRTVQPGYAGHYLLIFESDAVADRARREPAIAVAAFAMLDRGSRIFFFTRMSAYFEDLLDAADESLGMALAVDLHNASTDDALPTRVFLLADSAKDRQLLHSVFRKCCSVESTLFARQAFAARNSLLAVPQISAPSDAQSSSSPTDLPGTMQTAALASSALPGRRIQQFEEGSQLPTSWDELGSSDYTPRGHHAFQNQYFCTATGIPRLRQELRCEHLLIELAAHLVAVVGLVALLVAEGVVYDNAPARMQAWVLQRVEALDDVTNGGDMWAALGSDLVAFVELLASSPSSSTVSGDYTGDVYALIGGAEPLTVTRAIASTSHLCSSVVDLTTESSVAAGIARFNNTGTDVFSWESFKSVLTTNLGVEVPSLFRASGTRDDVGSCGVQVLFGSRDMSSFSSQLNSLATEWGSTLNETINIVVTYPVFNVNAGMILQCSTKYDVASATNRVVGSTGCSPIFADLGGAFGARDSVFEIATAVLTIFVCLHHFVFAVRGFRFLWLGVWPDNFGGFFLVLHCLVVVTSIVSLVVRFVVRRLVSTDAMLQAVQQGLALEFIDAVALAQLSRTTRMITIFFVVAVYSFKFLSEQKLFYLIPEVAMGAGPRALGRLSPVYALLILIAIPLLILLQETKDAPLLQDWVLQLFTSQTWRLADDIGGGTGNRQDAYSSSVLRVIFSLIRTILGYITGFGLIGVAVVGVDKFLSRNDLSIARNNSKNSSSETHANPLVLSHETTSKEYSRALWHRRRRGMSTDARRLLQQFVDDFQAQPQWSRPLYLSFQGLRRRLRSTAFLAVPSLAKARATRNSTTISDTNIVDTTDSSVHPKNRPTSVDEDVPRSLRSRLPRATTREYASRLVDEVAEVILLADSENLTFLPLADRLLAQALEALDIAAVHHQSADSGGSLVSSYFRVTNMLQNQSDAHGSESHLSDQNAFLKERLGLAPTTSDISLGNIYVNSTLRLLLLRAHVSLVNDYARQHWLCLQNQLRDFEERQTVFFREASVLSNRLEIYNQKYSTSTGAGTDSTTTLRPRELATSIGGNQSNLAFTGGADAGSSGTSSTAPATNQSVTAMNVGQGEYAHAFSVQSQAKGLRAALAAHDRDREDRLIAQLDDESGGQLLVGSHNTTNDISNVPQQPHTLRSGHGIDADAALPAVQSELQLPAAIASLPGGLDQNWEHLQMYLDGEVGSASDALEQVRNKAYEGISASAATPQDYDPNAPNPKDGAFATLTFARLHPSYLKQLRAEVRAGGRRVASASASAEHLEDAAGDLRAFYKLMKRQLHVPALVLQQRSGNNDTALTSVERTVNATRGNFGRLDGAAGVSGPGIDTAGASLPGERRSTELKLLWANGVTLPPSVWLSRDVDVVVLSPQPAATRSRASSLASIPSDSGALPTTPDEQRNIRTRRREQDKLERAFVSHSTNDLVDFVIQATSAGKFPGLFPALERRMRRPWAHKDKLLERMREGIQWLGLTQAEKNALVLARPLTAVGKLIDIKWTHGWFRGVITHFSPDTGWHTVQYDDKEIRRYDLSKKMFKVL